MADSILFGRFVKLLNWIHYELLQETSIKTGAKPKALEPVKLHVYIPPDAEQGTRFYLGLVRTAARKGHANKEVPFKLDLDTFKFILSQVPAVQEIEFSGWGEPFNNPAIFDMIKYAKQCRIDCHVVSHGLFNNNVLKALFASGLNHVTINCLAHKPSAFSAISKRNPAEFLEIEKNIEQLLLVRRHYPQNNLTVELSMIIDLMTLGNIPEMVHYAEELGVDAIKFDNHLGNNPEERSLQTVLTHYKKAGHFLKQLTTKNFKIPVTLPVLLDPDMEQHRFCEEPHTTVSIDENLYISPCSRQLVFNELTHSIWDQDFWNNDQYQWLRNRHNNNNEAVPKACQFCPKNMKNKAVVLEPSIIEFEELEPCIETAEEKQGKAG